MKQDSMTAHAKNIKAGGRRGQALAPVILVMLIFTVIALSFAGSASREVRASANSMHAVERALAAQGAINYAMAALAQTSKYGGTYGVIPPSQDTDGNGWRRMGDAFVKFEVIDTGAFLSLNTIDKEWFMRLPPFQNDEDLVNYLIDWRSEGDQSAAQAGGGKSDYYQSLPAPYNCKQAPFESVEETLLVKGMTPQTLYATLSGNPAQKGGANEGYNVNSGLGGGSTRQVAPPSNGGGKPNAPSNPTNRPSNPQSSSSAQEMQDFKDIFDKSQIPLAELLTPHSVERNASADGSQRVNVNTATEQELTQAGLTSSQAQAIIGLRNGSANNNNNPNGGGAPPTDTPTNGPPTNSPPPFGGGNPPPFGGGGRPRPGNGGGRPRPGRPGGGFRAAPITRQTPTAGNGNPNGGTPPSTGDNANANDPNAPKQPANPIRSLSALLDLPGFTRATMQQIADKIAFDDSPSRSGVVNVNTAPAEVLATVPGMTRKLLDAILGYRDQGKAFQTIGDLFVISDMGRRQCALTLPYLCTKSATYLVRVKVRVQGRQGIAAYSALVEMTANGPRVSKWGEVSRTSWERWVPPRQLPMPGEGESVGSAPDEPVSN